MKRPGTVGNNQQVDGLVEYCSAFDHDDAGRAVQITVSAFLESTGISPARFGRMVLGDSGLMHRIERGRSLTLRTADRILAFVAGYDGQSGGARDPPLRPRRGNPSREPGRTKKSTVTTEQPRDERTSEPTRILRLPEVQARTGLSRTTIYRWRVEGRFPQAVPLGTRCVGWIESELEAWLRERMAARRGVVLGGAR